MNVVFPCERGGVVSAPHHRKTMTESTEHQFTRRRLLGGAAVATGAGMAAVALPPNVRKALAAPVHHGSGSLRDIEHVVLLMQENRSFDHYFGTFSGVR